MQIGLTLAESSVPRPPVPYPSGAPNVLLVILDDCGFAQLGCYGGPIATPTIDARIPFISTANGTWTTAGYGTPFPVSDEYEPPLRLAALKRIVIDTGTSSLPGLEQLLDDAMRHQ